ncbi:hypothetical protein EVAR_42407_1 [Eumeta japonica]|uniref:Uncharacterized protein n=1 Tax=Eumeta variegata TaxID=151549 RepID=A0A4C1X9D6_EUMVA|nr:hypothetical protein EVAR_42407_1 [Eumeta japonica]
MLNRQRQARPLVVPIIIKEDSRVAITIQSETAIRWPPVTICQEFRLLVPYSSRRSGPPRPLLSPIRRLVKTGNSRRARGFTVERADTCARRHRRAALSCDCFERRNAIETEIEVRDWTRIRIMVDGAVDIRNEGIHSSSMSTRAEPRAKVSSK